MMIRLVILSLSILSISGCMKPSQKAGSSKNVEPPPAASISSPEGMSSAPNPSQPSLPTEASSVAPPANTAQASPTPAPSKSTPAPSKSTPTPSVNASTPASPKASPTVKAPTSSNPFLPNDQQPKTTPAIPSATAVKPVASAKAKDETSRQFNCLNKYYPKQFKMSSDKKFIVFNDGTKLVWDDGRNKVPDELFGEADINDIFHDLYNPGIVTYPPVRDFDPGRYRPQAFYKKLFGSTEAQVRVGLVQVPLWKGERSRLFSKKFGADKALNRVVKKLDALLIAQPAMKQYLVSPIGISGTFVYRNIANSEQQSMHAYGVAIDIVTAKAHYWSWDLKKFGVMKYSNIIPYDIVQIFESEKFIWGGKWHHYDTMHFEYRPELFCMLETK